MIRFNLILGIANRFSAEPVVLCTLGFTICVCLMYVFHSVSKYNNIRYITVDGVSQYVAMF